MLGPARVPLPARMTGVISLSEVLASMVKRQNRDHPSERQLRLSEMAWRYGNWLREGADRHGLPVVAARPRETLTDRIIDHLGIEGGLN